MWSTAAALAWLVYFTGALWTAIALTALAVYLRFKMGVIAVALPHSQP